MSSLTTTWSPNSFQLRLALHGRKTPTVVIVRTRIHKLDRRFRLFSVVKNGAVNGYGVGRRLSGDSWAVNSNSSVDGFAGWTGDEHSGDSRAKLSLKEIVGAGAAGVVLVAGLTFAALSIGKRNTSGPKQKMEPLATTEEMSMAYDDLNGGIKEDKKDSDNDARDFGIEQSMANIEKDPSSSTVSNEAIDGKHIDDAGMDDTPRDGSGTNFAPIKQDLQNESPIDDMLAGPEDLPEPPDTQIANSSFLASRFETIDAHVPSDNPGTLSESERDNLATNSLPFTDGLSNLNNVHEEDLFVMRETGLPNYSLELPKNEHATSTSAPYAVLEPNNMSDMDIDNSSSSSKRESSKKEFDPHKTQEVLAEGDGTSLGLHNITTTESTGTTLLPDVAYPANKQHVNVYGNTNEHGPLFDSSPGNVYSSAGIPAPSVVSAALQAVPGKLLVPAAIDQVQAQAFAALQALRVIEADVQPGDLCTRREYARWLVSASSVLSRSSVSKVYPAMYIENVTELAFDDITAEDPDFPSIQGLAEAGLISSKLSRQDMQSSLDGDPGPFSFSPESPLSRQDLVSWKMALEKKLLPVVDRKNLQQLTGFIDVDKINPDAWPAVVADLAAGEQGIMALAFGYTRLFQPDKPVTKAQAAIALSTGEASDIVGEELARIEAESMAEKVVAAQNALVAQVEKDVNATFEKELQLEREKIDAVEKLAEATRLELERLRAEREEENVKLMKERATVDSEMEVLSRLRREVEEHLQTLMSNKVEISYEKERLSKLRQDAEFENKESARLHYELEVERKALSMARSWAEEEAKRAREQAKSLEEAREHWARQGIKVVVDDDLREEEIAGVTWLGAGKEVSVEGTVDRAETLVDRLKSMADVVSGKARDTINKIIQMMLHFIDILKEWMIKAGRQTGKLKDTAVSKMGSSLQELQESSSELSSAVKGGIKRVTEDCREGFEKITQKFKA